MAERGDILRLKNRLGFLPRGEIGAAVVVQVRSLNDILPTLLVVPLDQALAPYASDPTAVPVSSREAGSKTDQVALATQVRPILLDNFSPGAAGRLLPATLARLDRVLRLVLGL
jgi:mRNA-degrading endonuclease toxin of MazEF toxin-antitoxin module